MFTLDRNCARHTDRQQVETSSRGHWHGRVLLRALGARGGKLDAWQRPARACASTANAGRLTARRRQWSACQCNELGDGTASAVS